MRQRLAAVALVVLLTASSGCLDLFGRALKDYDVARTGVDTVGWNTDGVFTVQVREVQPLAVRIEARSTTGFALDAEGLSNATLPAVRLEIPDGTWTIVYFVDGSRWETFKDARFDSTAPSLTGLESVGSATPQRTYVLGADAVAEPGASIEVIDQAADAVVARALPYAATGLADGIHAYDVILRDAAGNEAVHTVQVRVGSAQLLPSGQHTFGLVARYTLDVELWDISDLDSWISPAAARGSANNQWLGAGRGVRPDDPTVRGIVNATVTNGMSTGAAALALFEWMANELDYDTGRLDEDDLLDPAATVANGGGVCRDLAGLYVSLLRAAGIPARLVTGYLGGEVNGFHAWVEFYGGSGHGPSPWVPVDVSAIGSDIDPARYSADMALQSFGLRHTNMLPLRVVSEIEEDGAWSTAVSVQSSFPRGAEPTITLAKTLRAETPPRAGVLCVDRESLARLDVRRADDCPAAFPLYLRDFERSASLILDYGATVVASDGTTVTLTVSYPDANAVAPGTVEQQTYGATFRERGEGTKVATWTT